MVNSLQEAYPGVAAIVETDLNFAQVTFELYKILGKNKIELFFQVDLGEGVEIVARTELSNIASR